MAGSILRSPVRLSPRWRQRLINLPAAFFHKPTRSSVPGGVQTHTHKCTTLNECNPAWSLHCLLNLPFIINQNPPTTLLDLDDAIAGSVLTVVSSHSCCVWLLRPQATMLASRFQPAAATDTGIHSAYSRHGHRLARRSLLDRYALRLCPSLAAAANGLRLLPLALAAGRVVC